MLLLLFQGIVVLMKTTAKVIPLLTMQHPESTGNDDRYPPNHACIRANPDC